MDRRSFVKSGELSLYSCGNSYVFNLVHPPLLGVLDSPAISLKTTTDSDLPGLLYGQKLLLTLYPRHHPTLHRSLKISRISGSLHLNTHRTQKNTLIIYSVYFPLSLYLRSQECRLPSPFWLTRSPIPPPRNGTGETHHSTRPVTTRARPSPVSFLSVTLTPDSPSPLRSRRPRTPLSLNIKKEYTHSRNWHPLHTSYSGTNFWNCIRPTPRIDNWTLLNT